jgi:hypothetical protein
MDGGRRASVRQALGNYCSHTRTHIKRPSFDLSRICTKISCELVERVSVSLRVPRNRAIAHYLMHQPVRGSEAPSELDGGLTFCQIANVLSPATCLLMGRDDPSKPCIPGLQQSPDIGLYSTPQPNPLSLTVTQIKCYFS